VQRNPSTVVCLVGDVGEPLRRVLGSHTTYVLDDDDPLGPVADAWIRRFEESGPIGELEVATAETLARWRARSVELPDYYFVVGVDTLSATRRHWYFGVLHDGAPRRVVPVDADAGAVLRALESLAPAPWWPPLDRLLHGIEHRAPELHSEPSGAVPQAQAILKAGG